MRSVGRGLWTGRDVDSQGAGGTASSVAPPSRRQVAPARTTTLGPFVMTAKPRLPPAVTTALAPGTGVPRARSGSAQPDTAQADPLAEVDGEDPDLVGSASAPEHGHGAFVDPRGVDQAGERLGLAVSLGQRRSVLPTGRGRYRRRPGGCLPPADRAGDDRQPSAVAGDGERQRDSLLQPRGVDRPRGGGARRSWRRPTTRGRHPSAPSPATHTRLCPSYAGRVSEVPAPRPAPRRAMPTAQ